MAKEYVAVIGSGTTANVGPFNPSMSGAFPDGRYPVPSHHEKNVRARMGTGVAVLNPEDFSVFLGLNAQAILVGGTATALPLAALTNRRALAIHNNGPGTLFIGRAGVTTSDGFPLAINEKIGLDILGNDNVTVYGISDSSCDVRILELA